MRKAINSIKDFILHVQDNGHLIASLDAFCQLYERQQANTSNTSSTFTSVPTVGVSGPAVPASRSVVSGSEPVVAAARSVVSGSEPAVAESGSAVPAVANFLKTSFQLGSECSALIKEIIKKYGGVPEKELLADSNVYKTTILLFEQLACLHQQLKSNLTQPINQDSNVIANINGLMLELSKVIDVYNQLCKANYQQRTIIDNDSASIKIPDNFVEQLIREVIDPKNHFINYPFTLVQIAAIKKSIGKELFEKLLDQYKLSPNNLTLDDFRMILIGVTVNCNQSWETNEFIRQLLDACNIQGNLEDPTVIDQLRSKIKLDEAVWKRITAETRRSNYLGTALKYLNSNFANWEFLIPIRFKANSSFKRDYKSFMAITNISDWDLTNDSQHKHVQQFASEEHLFNNLSATDFPEGAIIPTLSKNGEKIFYRVKHIIDENSIHGFALVPVDPKKSLDIKVVFKNTHNLSKALLDLEHYLPYKEFKNHKTLVMQKLNQIVEEFKQELPEDSQKKSVSLNIGGHGTGGTLASCLLHEIISQKAQALTQRVLANDPDKKQELAKYIANNVVEQLDYEMSIDPSLSKLDPKKHHKKYLEAIDKTNKYAEKHILDATPQLDGNSHLLSIDQLHLSTINAGGVPLKIKNNFVQALKLLKDQQFAGSDLQLSYNKIVNIHDIVKKRGTIDLGAYIRPELMSMKVLQVASQDPNYKHHLIKIGLSSALMAGKIAIDTTTIALIPYISPLVNLTVNLIKPLGYNEITKNIIDNAKEIWRKANSIHYNSYLNSNKQDFTYKVLDNTNLSDQNEIIQELNSRARNATENSKFYRKLKKTLYKFGRRAEQYIKMVTVSDIKPQYVQNSISPPSPSPIVPSFNSIVMEEINKVADEGSAPNKIKLQVLNDNNKSVNG